MTIRIEEARFPQDADAIRFLFRGYAASLGIDLGYQNFQHELDSLPGRYSSLENGALLIAHARGKDLPWSASGPSSAAEHPPALGCVALRDSSDGWCEMKRLYVIDEARGEKLGVRLLEAVLTRAKALRYRGIRLDTLSSMTAARKLYQKFGFVEIPPYYDTPIEGTLFMGCDISKVA